MKTKKFLSLIITLVIIMSTFCSMVVTAETEALKKNEVGTDKVISSKADIVFAIDSTGSMSGYISSVRKNLTNFVKSLNDKNVDLNMSVIDFKDIYAHEETIVHDFNGTPWTKDVNKVINVFQSIKVTGGGDGPETPLDAFEKIKWSTDDNSRSKFVFLLTDANYKDYEDTEENNNQGHYSMKAWAEKFRDNNVKVTVVSEKNFEKEYNYLSSFTDGKFIDITTNDYYKLMQEYSEWIYEVLNPFTITLTHNKETVITDTNPTGNFIFTYKIKAVIKNDNSKQANNVKAHINLDNGMNLYNSQKEINIGTLEANETKELEWTVEIPLPIFSDITTKQYSVTASSDNTVDISSYDKIIIDETASDKNNELDFNKDIWSFENYSVDKKVPLIADDYNALFHGRSNTEKESLYNIANCSHSGQCYGMAATTVLSKMKIINISNLQENANCLYDIPKNERAMSLIGYYYCTQCLDNITNERAEFNEKSIQDKLATIKSLAQNVSKGGTPFILSFSGTTNNEDWGHAVVAYAYESGNFHKNNRDYSNRILIYDNNYPEWNEDSCLYFNEADNSWYIPNYSDATTLTRALSDLKIMDCSDIETNKQSATAILTATNKTIELIITSPNKTYKIDGIRTTDLNVFHDDGTSTLNIVLPDKEDTYNVSNENGSGLLDLSLKYQNYFMTANSSECESADFNPNGSVGIKGNKADFKISLTGNDGYTPLQWYTISAMGNNTSNPSLTKDKNGYILDGDNLSNVTITGRNDEETKELTFTTTEDKVLIGENKNELTVSIDKDNDGTYETVIANSGNKNNEKETAELKNLKTENFKLTPVFASSVRDYTSTVDYSVSKVSLTPTLEKGTTATISVNSSKAIAFDKKQTVDLKVGENKIEIVVSGDNLVSSKYTIIVTRSKAKEVKSQNNNSNNNTNNNKTNYTDKSPNTGDYIAKMSLVTAFVLISSGIILFARLHLKTKRKKDL